MIKKWWRTSSPQLRQGLFPASEKKKKKTGWKSSSADVPDICDRRSQPRPAQTEAAPHYCWLQTFTRGVNFLMIQTNKPPPQINTFILNWHSQIPVAFSCYLSPHYSACKKRPCEFENRFRKTRTARPKKWLEVVGDPAEHNYNYLVSIWSCGLPVPGVDLLLSAVWARPNAVRLLKTRSKERAWHDLSYSLDIVVFSGIHVGQISAGPIAPAVIYHNLLWLYYSIRSLFFPIL